MTRNVNLQTEDAVQWAEALVLLDVQVPHLAQSPHLRLRVESRNGRPRLAARAHQASGATWHPIPGVWVRYSCGFPWRGRKRQLIAARVQTVIMMAQAGMIDVAEARALLERL